MAGGILAPQPGIKPIPPALEVQSFNHWTTYYELLDGLSLSIFVYTILRIVWTHSRPSKHVSELNRAPD